MPAITIDKKISLSILWTMIGSMVVGVAYLTTANNSLRLVVTTLTEVKTAVESNTQQIIKSDRAMAIHDTLITMMDRRIASLEEALKR